jgi:hypothetical protein
VDPTWVVVVEAAGDPSSGRCDVRELRRLLEALDAGAGAGALNGADRYVLQVRTTGSNPGEALVGVLCRWSKAVPELDLPPWKVVRAEVLTPEELQSDLEEARRGHARVSRALPEPGRADDGETGDHLLRDGPGTAEAPG